MSNGNGTSLSKEQIVGKAVAAAMTGISQADDDYATEEVEAVIQGHWNGRYDDNKEVIEAQWDERETKALDKAQQIGVRSVGLAKVNAEKTITLARFKQAIELVNAELSKQNYSEWC